MLWELYPSEAVIKKKFWKDFKAWPLAEEIFGNKSDGESF